MFALVLISSIFISSPDPWTFFTRPEWMPSSVYPDRTPGSEDATNATRRLDPTALAAVNACFDAFCERAYFLNEGNSNVWDTAEWGATVPNDEFLFAPTNGHVARWHYDPDTNRYPNTRRLVEYLNLRGLALLLGSDCMSTVFIDDALRLPRPLWGDSVSPSSPSAPNFLVSSSRFDEIPEGSVPIPVTTDRPDPWVSPDSFINMLSCSNWAHVAMTFGTRRPEHTAAANEYPTWDNAFGPIYLPTAILGDLNFNEPPFTDPGWRVPDYIYYRRMPSALINSQGYFDRTTADIVGRGSNVCDVTTIVTTNWIALARDADPPMTPELALKKSIYQEAWDHYLIYWNERQQVSGSVWTDGLSSPPNYETVPGGGVVIRGGVSADVTIRYVGEPWGSLQVDSTVSARLAQDVPLDVSPPLGFIVARRTNDFTITSAPSSQGYLPSNYVEAWFGVDGYNQFVTPRFGDPILMVGVVSQREVTNSVTRFVGFEGIANDTRRLVTDRVAGIGRALAAIDRSYHPVAPVFSSVGSNVHYSASIKMTADDVLLKVGWEGSAGTLAEDVTVGPFKREGTVEWTTNFLGYVHNLGNHFEVRVSDVENLAGFSLDAPADAPPIVDVSRVAKEAFAGGIGDLLGQIRFEGPFTVEFGTATPTWRGNSLFVDLNLTVVVDYEGEVVGFPTYVRTGPFEAPQSEFLLSVNGSYGRSYSVMRHHDVRPKFPDGHPVAPGVFGAATGRAVSSALWTVSSVGELVPASSNAVIRVETSPCVYDDSDDFNFTSLYRSTLTDFSGASDCRDRFLDEFDRMVQKVRSLANEACGSDDVFEPKRMIDLSVDDLDPLVIPRGTSVSFNASGLFNTDPENYHYDYIRGAVDANGAVTLSDNYYGLKDGRRDFHHMNWPLQIASIVVNIGMDLVPHVNLEPVRGVSAGGKVESWSQIDWQWNALRLEKE